MAGDFLNPQPAAIRQRLLDELTTELRPYLYDEERGWWVDYVRLRVAAMKPED